MAKLCVKPGATDVTLLVFIQDSTSTTGAGKTGLAYNTASLVCYYARPGAAAAALSLVTQTVTGAHSDGGFVEVDATNMPGVYRLDLSDAVIAVGVRSAVVMLKGATGMAPLTLEIDLNAETNVTHWLGTACATPTVAGVPEVDITHFNGTAGTFASGRPEVNTSHIAGSAVSTSSAQIGVNVVNFGGSAGTFASGRPEVNTSHWAGTAVASAYVQANTAQFAGQTITCAGGVTIQAGIQASQADVAGLQGSVDGLYSGVPCTSMSAGVITAAAIATGAIDADAIADNAIDAGAIATGAITAAKFASAAIDAAAIAPDAGTEIGTAVWASAARTLTAATNITSTGGSVPITVGGKVEADVKAINAVTVDGAGTGGNPWGPA